MWVLDSSGAAFQGRRLWLRPGKRYLIGRTSSEAGQLVITHKTISRKHLTITVGSVPEGDAQNLASRSRVTIEDLNTSKGTFIDGESIQNQTHEVSKERIEFTMGKCPEVFRITWVPVVLTYSFTSRELKNDPLRTLRTDLEQLDIKFITEYNVKATTHVVSKKRNTSKGLQALINGKYIVSGSFTDSIIAGATVQEGDECQLEVDFDATWPNELEYLPPRGSESTQSSTSHYAPDPDRKEIFSGFTFIFYDKAQWDNLLAPITNGRGKALYFEVVPNETQVNDFVRFVKSVAGEKGLGSFEDGSEGRGAVVVRYIPAKGDDVSWYTEFTTAASLLLDHRPIEQKEFLEAILSKDAMMLRRPLPIADRPVEDQVEAVVIATRTASVPPDVEMANLMTSTSQEPSQTDQKPASLAASRRARVRRPATKRFKGFDSDEDDSIPSIQEPASAPIPESHTEQNPSPGPLIDDEEGLFVSQGSVMASQDAPEQPRRNTRKRRGHPLNDEDDIMDDIAPTAAAAKRRRIAMGEEPVARDETPKTMDVETQSKQAEKPKKIKKEIDVLEVARKTREEAEARARAEQEDLNNLPDDINLAEIRKLAIVEEMTVRIPPSARTREQDIADGRWDPKWNGRKNFKKFRARGEAVGRPVNRNIISLTQVKSKEFGIGDDYWLEDDSAAARHTSQAAPSQSSRGAESNQPAPTLSGQTRTQSSRRHASRRTVSDDSDEEEDEISLGITELEHASSTRMRSTGTTQRTGSSQATPTRSQTRASTQPKRPASTPIIEQQAKRPRQTRRAVAAESEDSDEEVGFKFGRRR
ncbi:hypothetical protein jhhlp_004532 [Lomentospora prolificans]|uniref:FHA domain-containing protein n=1 Tax=Lomentospora prolificans TaxID=41688 RepID=A0A2N3NBV0_9PEZI|nr:hypothetical protein jhhlp_004532 [Lomentospora prolificans]